MAKLIAGFFNVKVNIKLVIIVKKIGKEKY